MLLDNEIKQFPKNKSNRRDDLEKEKAPKVEKIEKKKNMTLYIEEGKP